MSDTPSQGNLSSVLVVFLADLDEGGVFDQFGDAFAGGVDLVLVAEGEYWVMWMLCCLWKSTKEGWGR